MCLFLLIKCINVPLGLIYIFLHTKRMISKDQEESHAEQVLL